MLKNGSIPKNGKFSEKIKVLIQKFTKYRRIIKNYLKMRRITQTSENAVVIVVLAAGHSAPIDESVKIGCKKRNKTYDHRQI